MGLSDRYTPSGLGMSPKADFRHAHITNALVKLIETLIDHEQYYVFTETQIIPDDKKSKVPDVILYKISEGSIYEDTPVFFIEVENTKMQKKTWDKLEKLMVKEKVTESFLINYETLKWYKYFDSDTFTPKYKIDSWSDFFKIDLINYVRFLDKRLQKEMYNKQQ